MYFIIYISAVCFVLLYKSYSKCIFFICFSSARIKYNFKICNKSVLFLIVYGLILCRGDYDGALLVIKILKHDLHRQQFFKYSEHSLRNGALFKDKNRLLIINLLFSIVNLYLYYTLKEVYTKYIIKQNLKLQSAI